MSPELKVPANSTEISNESVDFTTTVDKEPLLEDTPPVDTLPAPKKEPLDDLNALIIRNRENLEFDETLAEFESFQFDGQEPVQEEEEFDPNDPLGIVTGESLLNILKGGVAVGKDLVHGIVETPAAIVRGGIGAFQQVLYTVDDLASWLNDNVVDLGGGEGKEFGFKSLPEIPKPDEAESVTGGVVDLVSQFVLAWIPFLKAAKILSGASKFGRTSKLVQAQLAGAAAMAVAFDPMEQRLADLVESNPALSNVVTEYLQSKPENSAAHNRFLAGLEGLITGAGAEVLIGGFMKAVNVLKARRIERGVKPGAPLNEVDEAIDIKFGDPDAKFISDESAAEFLTTQQTFPLDKPAVRGADGTVYTGKTLAAAKGKATKAKNSEDSVTGFINEDGAFITQAEIDVAYKAARETAKKRLPFKINWAKIQGIGDIDQGLETVAKMFRKIMDEARRGTIGDEALAKLADDLNMTPEELLSRQPGEAWPAEKLLAAGHILDASMQEVKRLGKVAWNSTDEVDLAIFRKMFNIHVAIQANYQGLASEAGRALRVIGQFGGSKQKQLAQLQELLMAEGGPDQLRRLANAVSQIDDPKLFNKVTQGSGGKRAFDMVIEAWYFSLLSGPVTHAVNVSTSAVNMLWSIPTRAIAARISKLRGTEGPEIGEASAMLYGMIKGFSHSFRMAGRTLATGEQQAWTKSAIQRSKQEDGLQRAITGQKVFGKDYPVGHPLWFASKVVDGVGEYVFRLPRLALSVEDEFFKQMAMGMNIPATALRTGKAEGLSGKALATRIDDLTRNPTEAMIEEGFELGESFTFLTPLGDTGKRVQSFINKHPIMKFAFPFIRTPVNLTKFAGRSTPLGLISKGLRDQIAAGGVKGDLALAQMVMGSALALTMADQALQGNVTGAGPTDKKLRETWLRDNQPFSIRMPIDIPADGIKKGDWISYNRTDPFGLLMGAAASFAEVFGSGDFEELSELAVGIAVALSRSVFNKTWMRGPSDLLDAMTKPDDWG